MVQGFVRSRAARIARGFTLVEMMVSVSIVGILAVVAYEGYHKYVTSSHALEASAMLAGIKNRQENYKAETGAYLSDSSNSLAANQTVSTGDIFPMCATHTGKPGKEKVSWPPGGYCTDPCCAPWLKLKINSTAPTYYGFSFIAGGSGATTGSVLAGGTQLIPTNATGPWFVATGVADTDGNGVFTTSMISSFDNEIHVDMENE